MPQTHLFLTFGYPGSGKSYFGSRLAEKLSAVHLRGDDMRLAMFGQDRPELHQARYHRQVYGGLNYVLGQILRAGHSVVYDANHNQAFRRELLGTMAAEHDARTVLLWVQVSKDLAKERVALRSAAGEQVVHNVDLVEKMAANMEPPTQKEAVIVIDGTMPFDEQYQQFQQQLATL